MDDGESGKRKRQLLKEFIQLYESFPCLWHIKSPEYHDKEMRAKAYKVLVKKLQQIQPDADRPAVVKKINCLRSNIRKEKKKTIDRLKAGRAYKTKLWYYPLFNFLNGVARRPRMEGLEDVEIIKVENGKTCDPLDWACKMDEESFEDTYEEGTEEELHEAEKVQSHPGPSNATIQMPSTCYEATQEFGFKERQQDDKHDVFAKNVAMKLRHIDSINDTQRIMAEKIINEALYMAELQLLTMQHCKVLQ